MLLLKQLRITQNMIVLSADSSSGSGLGAFPGNSFLTDILNLA
jgi:hypothetical protein